MISSIWQRPAKVKSPYLYWLERERGYSHVLEKAQHQRQTPNARKKNVHKRKIEQKEQSGEGIGAED